MAACGFSGADKICRGVQEQGQRICVFDVRVRIDHRIHWQTGARNGSSVGRHQRTRRRDPATDQHWPAPTADYALGPHQGRRASGWTALGGDPGLCQSTLLCSVCQPGEVPCFEAEIHQLPGSCGTGDGLRAEDGVATCVLGHSDQRSVRLWILFLRDGDFKASRLTMIP